MIHIVFGFGDAPIDRLYFSVINKVDFFIVIDHGIISTDIYSAVTAMLAVPFVGEHFTIEIGTLYFGIFFAAFLYESFNRGLQILICAPDPEQNSTGSKSPVYIRKSCFPKYSCT